MNRFQYVSMLVQERYTDKSKSEHRKSIDVIDKVIKSQINEIQYDNRQ